MSSKITLLVLVVLALALILSSGNALGEAKSLNADSGDENLLSFLSAMSGTSSTVGFENNNNNFNNEAMKDEDSSSTILNDEQKPIDLYESNAKLDSMVCELKSIYSFLFRPYIL